MRRDADFNGARPFVHHLVDANLKHLIGAQRPAAQDYAVVKVISRTVETVFSTSIAFLLFNVPEDYFSTPFIANPAIFHDYGKH